MSTVMQAFYSSFSSKFPIFIQVFQKFFVQVVDWSSSYNISIQRFHPTIWFKLFMQVLYSKFSFKFSTQVFHSFFDSILWLKFLIQAIHPSFFIQAFLSNFRLNVFIQVFDLSFLLNSPHSFQVFHSRFKSKFQPKRDFKALHTNKWFFIVHHNFSKSSKTAQRLPFDSFSSILGLYDA